MILAYQGQWSQTATLEKHALETARVLLPVSDTCIYIGFPWASLGKLQDAGDALRELTPKNKPGQRVVTVCESLDGNIQAELENLGVTDVFIANNEADEIRGEVKQSVNRRALNNEGSLWLNEVLAFFVEHSEYPPGTSFHGRLESDLSLASGGYKEQLRYLAAITQKMVTPHRKPLNKTKKKVFLFGNHSHRTPLSYPDCQYPLVEYVDIVDSLDTADIAVTGNRVDFIRNAQVIADWHEAKEDRQLYVISEEPYWDTMWDKEFRRSATIRDFAGKKIPFKRLNHVTSELFKWQTFPYYVTTENNFFARYAALFQRNAKLTADDWLAHWRQCQYPTAFIAEKRDEERFNVSFPEIDIENYCALRSGLAEESLSRGGFVEGKGWFSDSLIRQELDDWHLDKLTKLDMSTAIVSAIENTHQVDYVTEKVLDAFAVGGVPIYAANPDTHSVWKLVTPESLINLYGLDVNQCVEKVFGFTPDREFAEKYVEAQVGLAERFSKPWLLWQERKRLAGCLGNLLET